MKKEWLPFFKFCENKMNDIVPKNRFRDPRKGMKRYGKTRYFYNLLEQNKTDNELMRALKDILSYRQWEKYEKEKKSYAQLLNLIKRIKMDSDNFRHLMEEYILKGKTDDLQVNDKIAKIINPYTKYSFNGFIFWIFTEIKIIEKECDNPLRQILFYGDFDNIKQLSLEFLRYFNLTYTRIRETVANNLMEELSKEQTEAQEIINNLKAKQLQLEQQLEIERNNQLQKGIRKVIEKLQSSEQPLLNQFYNVYQLLLKKEKEGNELSHMELNLLIAFENFFKVLNSFEIQHYPTEQIFELDWSSLQFFQYQSGSNFRDETDVKTVVCKEIGWKYGNQILSKAIVEEWIEDMED
ncbi:MAG: hypothetical protein Kow0037_18270 [Calditrichia bacterium]